MNNNLYETDYDLWLKQQIEAVEKRDSDALDWDNLAEGLRDVSNFPRNLINDYLMMLLLYLMKTAVQRNVYLDFNSEWMINIARHRILIKKLIKQYPKTLDSYLQTAITPIYAEVLELLLLEKDWKRNKTYDYPKFCPFTIEQILDQNFFPNDQRIALPNHQVSD
ncbi:DUF29 family protein [Crocosphaera chwakensis]|uniref:DUF29 domain-containing protein n=1 Tax=Crocosphaera chwakensis CCY0110 TaxID=391612 RepID=A3IKN3_9CHRO|nr:DUF29 family protein [Crocosphaera chwakensis]EAZ92752.1 hypothetical protein CY0110_21687 [Crocosphaera chwakensis CCY0110]